MQPLTGDVTLESLYSMVDADIIQGSESNMLQMQVFFCYCL
jgi:hypothetical protein